MQALYATPAWACCFYVITFYTSFLSVKGHFPSKLVLHRRSSSVKGCLPSKVVFRQRSSSVKGHLPSKVVLCQRFLPSKVVVRQRLFSVKGYLILSYSIKFDCSTECGIAQLSQLGELVP